MSLVQEFAAACKAATIRGQLRAVTDVAMFARSAAPRAAYSALMLSPVAVRSADAITMALSLDPCRRF